MDNTFEEAPSPSHRRRSAVTLVIIIITRQMLTASWGEPERAKCADGMQLFALDCIAYNVDAEMDRVFACMSDM